MEPAAHPRGDVAHNVSTGGIGEVWGSALAASLFAPHSELCIPHSELPPTLRTHHSAFRTSPTLRTPHLLPIPLTVLNPQLHDLLFTYSDTLTAEQ